MENFKRSYSWTLNGKIPLIRSFEYAPGMITLRKKHSKQKENKHSHNDDEDEDDSENSKNEWDPETCVNWKSATEGLKKKYEKIQAVRVSEKIFDRIVVQGSTKGNKTIPELADLSVKGSEVLIHLHDPKNARPILKAIESMKNDLFGNLKADIISVPIPPITTEYRQSLCKMADRDFEDSKIQVRNLRKTALEKLKTFKFPKDDQRIGEKEVQKCHDDTIKELEKIHKEKNRELSN